MTSNTINERLAFFTLCLVDLQKKIPLTPKKELANLNYNIKVTEDKIKEIKGMIGDGN